MGLDDRDYMRERYRKNMDRMMHGDRDSPFTPPQEGPSLLTMALTWIGAAFLLYHAYGWWQDKKQVERQDRAHAIAKVNQESQAPRPSQSNAPQIREHPTARPHGAAFTPPAVIRTPEPSIQQAAPPATSGTIYHCQGQNGGTFWSQAPCSHHGAQIDRMASVPPGLPFDEQVKIAEQRRQALMGTLEAPSAPAAIQVTTTTSSNKAECERLDTYINQLDAMARQPQSAQTQDGIRMERKKARDRQFEIRC